MDEWRVGGRWGLNLQEIPSPRESFPPLVPSFPWALPPNPQPLLQTGRKLETALPEDQSPRGDPKRMPAFSWGLSLLVCTMGLYRSQLSFGLPGALQRVEVKGSAQCWGRQLLCLCLGGDPHGLYLDRIRPLSH